MKFPKWEAVRRSFYKMVICNRAAFMVYSNQQKPTRQGDGQMKAQSLYEQDLIDRAGGAAMPRQQYYAALRDALWQELMQQGYSDYLEQLLLDIRSGERDRIYVLDYAALMECHSMIVLGRELRDASEFVPHLHLRGEKAAWAAVEGPGSFLMPVTKDMTEQFRQLRAVSRQLVDARDGTVIPQAGDAAQREIEQVHTLNKMLDDRCQALQAERDELQSRLRLLEEGVITEQVRYAIEARRLQEEEALRQTYEAQKEAAKAAFRAQFAREQEDAALRREEEEQQLSGLRAQAARDYAAVRREMAEDLAGVARLLQERMAAWESSLNRAECLMLAQSYAALHDLSRRGMDALLLTAAEDGVAAALLQSVRDLQRQLTDRVQQLEQAMLRLGLVAVRPAAGEGFDGAYHVPAGVSAGAAGDAVIARCMRPGVMVQGAKEALLKAEVELK